MMKRIIICMVSAPTYDPKNKPSDIDTNPKYEGVYLNRVLSGLYTPGSTFKVAMSIAGLESGKITRYSQIRDDGVYTKYPGSSPKCLVYSRTGGTHGYLDVAGALRVSCNYFYYVLGDWMDWDYVDATVESLGLGEHTGIELGEAVMDVFEDHQDIAVTYASCEYDAGANMFTHSITINITVQ